MSICEYLQNHRIPFRAFIHLPVPSASRLARIVHVSGRRVAKAVLIGVGDGHLLAVLPATHRIDFGKLAKVLGSTDVRLAGEEEVVRLFPDCERGSLPPFGRPYGLRTIVDASLAGWAEIILEGNLRHEALRMRFLDYQSIEAPLRARFAEPACPRPRRPEPRRAG